MSDCERATNQYAFQDDLASTCEAPAEAKGQCTKPPNGNDSSAQAPKGTHSSSLMRSVNASVNAGAQTALPNGNKSSAQKTKGTHSSGLMKSVNASTNAGAQMASANANAKAWPGSAIGDKVESINFIDLNTIVSMVGSQCRNSDIHKNGLSSHLLDVFGGSYFYGNSNWTSNWIDDGYNDWFLTVSDVNISVAINLRITNPRQRTAHVESSATSGSVGTSANTNSEADTVGGNAEVSGSIGGGGKPGAGAKVGGNISQTETTTVQTGNTGSRSDTATYQNERMTADILMDVTVDFDPMIPRLADFSTTRKTFNIGDVIYLHKLL